MGYVKGAKASRPKVAVQAEPARQAKVQEPEEDLDDEGVEEIVEEIVLSVEDKASVAKTVALIDGLTPEVRTALIDEIMSRYCSMCSETLDEDGECPEGCDPDDMLDEEDDDEDDEDDENGDGEPDEDDDSEETEEET
jgi:hypothetical protein